MKYFFALILIVCAQAHADFIFKCQHANSKEDCLKEYRKLDDACCYARTYVREGAPKMADVTRPSVFCQVDDEHTRCGKDPLNQWSCKVTSAICTSVNDLVSSSQPPQYTCKEGANYAVVSADRPEPGPDSVGFDSRQKKPLFCVKKPTPAAGVPASEVQQ
jgi:hypothetical protein